MSNEQIFAQRLTRINKTAAKQARQRKPVRSKSLSSMLVMPLMVASFMSGGVVFTWELMDRPTDNPLELASALTAQMLSY